MPGTIVWGCPWVASQYSSFPFLSPWSYTLWVEAHQYWLASSISNCLRLVESRLSCLIRVGAISSPTWSSACSILSPPLVFPLLCFLYVVLLPLCDCGLSGLPQHSLLFYRTHIFLVIVLHRRPYVFSEDSIPKTPSV